MTFLAYHGIGAYVGQKNPMALRRMLVTALTGVELCVSERAIGAIGAVLEGTIRKAFASDVWSRVEGGVRVEGREDDQGDDQDNYDYWAGRYAIPYGWVDGSDDGVSGEQYEPAFQPKKREPKSAIPSNQREFEDWTHSHHNPHYHAEAWMRATALRALWVKEWAPEATKQAAKILANSRGIPLFVVSGKNDKIWNLLDDVALWGDKYPRHDYTPPVEVRQHNAFTDFFGRKAA